MSTLAAHAARLARRPTRLPTVLGRAALAPLWAVQLLTGAKSFERNPLIGSHLLNSWGLHAFRVRFAYRLAEARRHRLAGLVSAADREAFARDGFVLHRDFLPAEDFTRLVAEVRAFRAGVREITEGDTVLRKIALDPKALRAMPALAAALRLPGWRGLIRYVGARDAEPVVWVQSILRHAADGPADPQTFLHADTFHPTVKAWLFLTDVEEDAGPFTYVPGSHRLTEARLRWEQQMSLKAPYSANAEIRQGSFRIDAPELPGLGLPPPRAFAVPANTLVVADTFGFHARGPSTRPSMRVEIWAYGRRSPFLSAEWLIGWSGAALARRSLLGWRLGDLREKAGLGRHRWRARPGLSAFDPPSAGSV